LISLLFPFPIFSLFFFPFSLLRLPVCIQGYVRIDIVLLVSLFKPPSPLRYAPLPGFLRSSAGSLFLRFFSIICPFCFPVSVICPFPCFPPCSLRCPLLFDVTAFFRVSFSYSFSLVAHLVEPLIYLPLLSVFYEKLSPPLLFLVFLDMKPPFYLLFIPTCLLFLPVGMFFLSSSLHLHHLLRSSAPVSSRRILPPDLRSVAIPLPPLLNVSP